MLPIHDVADAERYLDTLRLDPRSLIVATEQEDAVRATMADVAERGDAALVEAARKFDDPEFTADQLRVTPDEMEAAHGRVSEELRVALSRAIDQVRAYQQHIMPTPPSPMDRGGVTLGLRWTPLASAGCYFPGGKASYPSSLIHLAVPAQVAGVEQVVATTPPSKYGKSDLVLAAGHQLGLPFMIRAGGAAGIAALAFGTESVPAVDKIVGPGNTFVQIAKRLLAGGVGVDGFLGPSEVLVIADDTANPAFVAADLLAQAEHDPGSCFLLTDSRPLAEAVVAEVRKQFETLSRQSAIRPALENHSAIFVGDMDALLPLADRFAAEHVNLQTADPHATLDQLSHAGCVFIGPHSPVAAGDYVAGPSHCLPTNTTARFGGGISVFEFLKRTGTVEYTANAIAQDATNVVPLAEAEGLDAHASSVRRRTD
ncbi:MAG: histidinol dehydrogenase [Planctomycetota bacterium]